ncbi:MAG: tetratricopeptide repeat protein [Lachnospiraceae bacterium]|nr:tetratricopeptide repeat protein [Lachnospiraceae bacterium]
MRCYKCGARLSAKSYCTSCGTNVVLYKKIIRLSNTYYNDGLAKAQVRDLSGAIVSLKRCLKYNKQHVTARNLLGLVYFEVGEIVSALSEWIISSNLQEEDNIAIEYITTLQSNQGRLDGISQTIHKYNLSLEYTQQGSDDLAVIQLKKLLSINGNLVKGHQLLALLYLRQNDLQKAEKQLQNALRIDSSNTMTLRLMQELNEMGDFGQKKKNSLKSGKEEIEVLNSTKDQISYKNGNEMIIQPTVVKEHNGIRTMIDIVIGLAVGVALMWFLVMPAFRQTAKKETSQKGNTGYEELQKKNAQIDEMNDTIAALQGQLDSANGNLSSYTGEAGIVTRMEHMLNAYKTFAAGDIPAAFDILVTIDRTGLSENVAQSWQEMYNNCSAKIKEEAEKMYTRQGKAAEAVAYYQKLLAVEPANEELMFHCASAYKKAGQKQEAIDMFTKLMQQAPTGAYAAKATSALSELQR